MPSPTKTVLARLGFRADKGDFFFGAFGGVGDAYADFFGEGADFGFAVAGDENDFSDVMTR